MNGGPIHVQRRNSRRCDDVDLLTSLPEILDDRFEDGALTGTGRATAVIARLAGILFARQGESDLRIEDVLAAFDA